MNSASRKMDMLLFMVHLDLENHFLQTMAFSMAQKYSPDLLQFYVLDFGGRMLGNLREAPHCVAVAFEDEKQRVSI